MVGRKQKLRAWEMVGGGWEYHTPHLRIMVHNYVGYPTTAWFLTCYDLRIERMPLKAKLVEFAQAEALATVVAHVKKLASEMGIVNQVAN